MEAQVSWWIGFHVFVLAMLALDLGVFHKKNHDVSVKESLIWTGVWITLAMIFNYGVYHFIGERESYEFLTAYVLEKSLSVDNIFVMTLIFTYFKVEPKYQHRVLFWGILGALVMRILFIVGGVALIHHFHFILYFFGAFLVYTGIKMLVSGGDEEMNPEEGFIYRMGKKYFRMTEKFEGEKFFVIKNGIRHMTPLFLVLLIIESTDLIFAVDSIPATLSVTKNAFIAYTSNIFAILGLRSLYFAFAGVVQLFRFLSYALSVVLIFIGVKMLIEAWYIIPTSYSLAFVLGIIALSVLLSVAIPEKDKKEN
ncbi:TerC family protein [Bacteriovorax sp. PP10]|uniref:TerC family protein n=1 Tax=Bacteriovorax antarcticus TaxID=3088717 RepID=A0ABU5VPZ0_9BACT|nr:TerC family protein [Bacteriovorax sp. PP10]MEA9355113.1 TerC family protein [Bacteriovorax sp. PP10]